jgi:cytochrome P450
LLARELVADRRAQPRATDNDLPSAILAADIEGEPIDDDSAAGMLRLLISAGHNSTTSGLGNVLLHLARDAGAQRHLRANPAAIRTAIEELLRYDTPVQAMPRFATKALTLHGRTLEAGEKVEMFWGSANRDAAVLARMEIRVALEELLTHTESFEIDGDVQRTAFHRVGVTA